jgi:hypothetical protein
MLTQLVTVKTRLVITEYDVQYDSILTNAIKAVTARFDQECNRTLARTADAAEEFSAEDREIVAGCFPIESVSRFELKSSESEGWVEQTGVEFLLRRNCVISLAERMGNCGQLARVIYTGGYVLPGTTPGAGQTALPDDLEQAAVEQVAAWFQSRDKLGLIRHWPKGGIYQEFAQTELLITVAAVLRKYERMVV